MSLNFDLTTLKHLCVANVSQNMFLFAVSQLTPPRDRFHGREQGLIVFGARKYLAIVLTDEFTQSLSLNILKHQTDM